MKAPKETTPKTHRKEEVKVEAEAETESESEIDFSRFGLPSSLLQGLTENKYIHPTPIQEEIIPLILS